MGGGAGVGAGAGNRARASAGITVLRSNDLGWAGVGSEYSSKVGAWDGDLDRFPTGLSFTTT